MARTWLPLTREDSHRNLIDSKWICLFLYNIWSRVFLPSSGRYRYWAVPNSWPIQRQVEFGTARYQFYYCTVLTWKLRWKGKNVTSWWEPWICIVFLFRPTAAVFLFRATHPCHRRCASTPPPPCFRPVAAVFLLRTATSIWVTAAWIDAINAAAAWTSTPPSPPGHQLRHHRER